MSLDLSKYIIEKLSSMKLEKRELFFEVKLILEYTSNLSEINNIIFRRLKREPIQYILGKAYFYDIELEVGTGVLIPRFDTEILVDKVIDEINNIQKTKQNIKILDICCGSGAIGLSILNNTKDTDVLFVDISDKALEYAKKNSKNLRLKKRSQFLISDMFTNINKNNKFDIIVCNPPYITEKEFKVLEKELFYEPINALVSEDNNFYKVIAEKAKGFLNNNGKIFVELNSNYSTEIKNIFIKKTYKNICIYKDYNNLDRVLCV